MSDFSNNNNNNINYNQDQKESGNTNLQQTPNGPENHQLQIKEQIKDPKLIEGIQVNNAYIDNDIDCEIINNKETDLFELNLQNYFDNLTKDNKTNKDKKQSNIQDDEPSLNKIELKEDSISMVDLKDKKFLNQLNYLVKKQRKLDRATKDCFINTKANSK